MTNDRERRSISCWPPRCEGEVKPRRPARCLDAETLAAWADGALDARERSGRRKPMRPTAIAVRTLLAAMVRTLPPSS